VRARRDFRLAGFMIMPDHAHWLALPRPEDTLSTIVQQWKRNSAMKINSLRRTRETLEYIHQNPVRKGMVAIPTDWDWSSARAYAGDECIIKIDFLNLPAQTEKPLP
ncbi:MAG: transposase, partial [Acidobacteria bacterium]|nr:transposase [Acidobacteriota bacterium]